MKGRGAPENVGDGEDWGASGGTGLKDNATPGFLPKPEGPGCLL
jgi:hypothetical protein